MRILSSVKKKKTLLSQNQTLDLLPLTTLSLSLSLHPQPKPGEGGSSRAPPARGRAQPRAGAARSRAGAARSRAGGGSGRGSAWFGGGNPLLAGEEKKFQFWGSFEGEINSPNSEFKFQKLPNFLKLIWGWR